VYYVAYYKVNYTIYNFQRKQKNVMLYNYFIIWNIIYIIIYNIIYIIIYSVSVFVFDKFTLQKERVQPGDCRYRGRNM